MAIKAKSYVELPLEQTTSWWRQRLAVSGSSEYHVATWHANRGTEEVPLTPLTHRYMSGQCAVYWSCPQGPPRVWSDRSKLLVSAS